MAATFSAARHERLMSAQPGHKGGCTVCAHTECTRLEVLLAGGAGQSAVARKFGLSKDAMHRHWRHHVSAERKAQLVMGPVQRQTLAAQVAEESTSVLDHYRAIRAGLYTFFTAALDAGDRVTGIQAGAKLKDVNDSIARVTGELASSPLVQQNSLTIVMQSPQVQEFMQGLMDQLARFPEAAQAVVGWLEAKEASALQVAALPALEQQP